MKKLLFFVTFVCNMHIIQVVIAQEPVATLEHGGTSKVFYGTSSFTDAYDASENSDQIYLSAGYFDAPASIAKGIKIFGAGHFPIEGKQTQITSGLTINKGADSLRLEGLYINGDINYDANNTINYVKVIRCGLGSVDFQSISALASKNYFSFEECIIRGSIHFSRYGNNFLLRNSIISGNVSNIDGNALIDGNIFLNSYLILNSNWVFIISNVKNSIIQNNIFLKSTYVYIFKAITGTTINKNLFEASGYGTYGYSGIARGDIFVNQSGNTINYSHDYHLKAPASYIGTDGKQVGLYGGLGFKENGIPSNPSIVSKVVDSSTDTNGNLQINFTVKAQDN